MLKRPSFNSMGSDKCSPCFGGKKGNENITSICLLEGSSGAFSCRASIGENFFLSANEWLILSPGGAVNYSAFSILQGVSKIIRPEKCSYPQGETLELWLFAKLQLWITIWWRGWDDLRHLKLEALSYSCAFGWYARQIRYQSLFPINPKGYCPHCGGVGTWSSGMLKFECGLIWVWFKMKEYIMDCWGRKGGECLRCVCVCVGSYFLVNFHTFQFLEKGSVPKTWCGWYSWRSRTSWDTSWAWVVTLPFNIFGSWFPHAEQEMVA